jgi:FK506-binding protein 1
MDEYGSKKATEEVALTVEITTVKPGDATHFPVNGQTCRVHYEAFLSSDGSKFDSSRDRGLPFEFVLGEGHVIPGWDKTIPKMSLVRVSDLLSSLLPFCFFRSASILSDTKRAAVVFSLSTSTLSFFFRARLSRQSFHQN